MEELFKNKVYARGTIRANRQGLLKNQILDKTIKKDGSEGHVSLTSIAWIK